MKKRTLVFIIGLLAALMMCGAVIGADLNSAETIRKVQQALNEAGFNSGPVDGIVGPKTRAAISEYRKEHDLPEGDFNDLELMTSLGLDTDDIEITVPPRESAPPKVVEDSTYEDTVTIEFGGYDQDGNIGNGLEPVRWIVIATDGDKAELLSTYALEVLPFHHEEEAVTWSDSDMRTWLNNDFYNAAFTDEEKQYILTTTLDNSNSDGWGESGGADTEDNVYLLSCGEAMPLKEDGRIRAPLTEHAIAQGAFNDDGYARWYLRSPGEITPSIQVVMTAEDTHESVFPDYEKGAVRPVIWIDASSLALE